jgi:hypothetical protein
MSESGARPPVGSGSCSMRWQCIRAAQLLKERDDGWVDELDVIGLQKDRKIDVKWHVTW